MTYRHKPVMDTLYSDDVPQFIKVANYITLHSTIWRMIMKSNSDPWWQLLYHWISWKLPSGRYRSFNYGTTLGRLPPTTYNTGTAGQFFYTNENQRFHFSSSAAMQYPILGVCDDEVNESITNRSLLQMYYFLWKKLRII